MRRPSRDIRIFSLSALDLLAMSTGVFILLLVLLMPYYGKTMDAGAAIEALRAASGQLRSETGDLARQIADLNRGTAAIRQRTASQEAEAQELERKAAPPATGGDGPDEQRVIEALDLVFVIDTTASMRPVIRDLALSLRAIVRILERLVPSVQIGVVAYKDVDSGLAPVESMQLAPTDPRLDQIIGYVERLEASTAPSQTIEEDVHLGLEAAALMRFRPDARQTLVLIGDAEVHEPLRYGTIEGVRRFVMGNEERTVSALFTVTPSAMARGLRARRFFEEVAAAGKGSFNDHAGSMVESVLLSVLVARQDEPE